MPTLNDLQLSSWETLTGNTGQLNDLLVEYLQSLAGIASNNPNDLWYKVLTDLGYTGTVQDMQLEYWADITGTTGQWNDLYYQWLLDTGGAFGPNALIVENGISYCQFPNAGNCTAATTYTANTSGFTNPPDTWLWSLEPPVAGVTITNGTTQTCTVTAASLDVDTDYNLKVVATDSVSTDTAERTNTYTSYHREDLVVNAPSELSNVGCIWDDGDSTGCTANASYTAVVTGTPPVTLVWSLSNITGGPAEITTGQGTASCTVRTTGPNEVFYRLVLTAETEFQTTNNFLDASMEHNQAPYFIGPDIGLVPMIVGIPFGPFDASARYTPVGSDYTSTGTAFPDGITMTLAGVVSGTPTTEETVNGIIITATNTYGTADSNSIDVVVDPAQAHFITIDETAAGSCSFAGPQTGCTANSTFFANPTGYVPDTWVWSITLATNCTATIIIGQGTANATVEVTNTTLVGPYSFNLQCIASNISESHQITNQFVQVHTDNTVAPAFVPPDITTPITVTQNVAMAPIDLSGKFSGYVQTYSLQGIWPAGIVIGLTTGIVSGTPIGPVASYPGLTIRASNYMGNADSNAIVADVVSGVVTPVYSGPVPDQQWINGDPVTLLMLPYFGAPSLPVTFTLESGVLPTGLILDTNSGSITGTPTIDSTGTYQVRCTNSGGFDVTNVFGWEVAASFITLPSFYALTPDETNDYLMEGVLIGTGGLTTTHTADLYAPDFNGVYQKYPTNAPVWSGGRVVLVGAAGTDVVSVHANDAPAGTPLPSAPYLQYYPAATNVCLYSNDLTDATWTTSAPLDSVTYDQAGLTGAPNTASLLDDSSTIVGGLLRQDFTPVSTQSNVAVLWVKKSATDVSRLAFDHRQGTGTRNQIGVNIQTGYAWDASSSAIDAIEVVDVGDWWKVLLEVTANTTSGRVVITPAAYPVDDYLGLADSNETGSIAVGNVEIYLNKTIAQVRGLGPIFTTTAAVSTDSTIYQANGNQGTNEAAWYMEIDFQGYSGEFAAEQYHIEGGIDSLPTGRIFATPTATLMFGKANVNPRQTVIWATDNRIGQSFSESENNSQVNIEGSWGIEASGTFVAVDGLLIGQGTRSGENHARGYRQIRRYDITTFQQGKDIIDDLMLTTLTMTAGTSGPRQGYETAVMGTLVPDNPFGFTINELSEQSNDIVLVVEGIQLQTIFEFIELDGVKLTMLAADSFVTGAGISTWTFNSTTINLISTTVYPVKVQVGQ